jgi:glutamate-1-semialdehyde 2,1-aminomutase
MSQLKSTYEEAKKYLIGGATAGGRFHGILGQPIYLEKASGARVYDVDGNEYIDYHVGAGASLYGYDHPRLRKAVEKALEVGFFMNFDTKHHVELAKLMHDMFPSAERIRLINTGTEATQAAIRLARSYTGKELVIKFEGHFHGMHENIWFNHNGAFAVDEHGEVETTPDTAGFPQSAKDPVKNIVFNDIEALEYAVEKYRGQVGTIIVEPISYNCGCYPARKEYLQRLREVCDKEDIVLIFDEVISGLRLRPGSAQAYYGVTPDLTTLGKAIGGGFSIAAVVGKEKIMKKLNPEGNTAMSGTYTGALIPVLAAVECFKMCKEPDFYDHIDSLADALYSGFNDLFKKHSLPGHVRGMGARFGIYFGMENPEDDYDFRKVAQKYDREMYKKFVAECLPAGLFFHDTSGAVSPAHYGFTIQHTLKDIEITLDKIDKIFGKIKK